MPTKKHAYAELPPCENHASEGKNVRTNTRNSVFPRALINNYMHIYTMEMFEPAQDFGTYSIVQL